MTISDCLDLRFVQFFDLFDFKFAIVGDRKHPLYHLAFKCRPRGTPDLNGWSRRQPGAPFLRGI
jgi:hypothetical protein